MSESLNRQEPHTRNHESPRGSYNLTPLSRVTAPRAIHDFHFFLLRLRLRLVLLPISSSSRSPVLDPSLADPPLSTSIAHFSHQHHPTGTPFRHCHQQDLSNTLKSDPPFSPAKSSPPPLAPDPSELQAIDCIARPSPCHFHTPICFGFRLG